MLISLQSVYRPVRPRICPGERKRVTDMKYFKLWRMVVHSDAYAAEQVSEILLVMVMQSAAILVALIKGYAMFVCRLPS